MHLAKPVSDPLQTLGERSRRRCHETVETQQEKLSRASLKGAQAGRQQIVRDIVIQLLLFRAHRVLVQLCPPADKGLVEEVLRLPSKRSLHHTAETSLQFCALLRNESTTVRFLAEQCLERGERPEQCPCRLDVMQQTPQFGQRVLEGGRREHQHRRWTNQLSNAMCCLCVPATFVVDGVAVEPPVYTGEYLVRLVDDAQIERR